MRSLRHAHPIAATVALLGTCAMLAACTSTSTTASPAGAAASTAAATTLASTTSSAAPATTATAAATTAAATTEAPTTAAPTTVPAATVPPTTAGAEPATPPTIAQLLALGRPIVLAHAGGEDERPHSTPFAFEESVAAGVDMLDFDVQLTKDGVLVVQHDDSVDRTTGATGKIADLTYAEIAALDNAYWFTATCTCHDQPDSAYLYRGIRTGERPPPPGHVADDFIVPRFADIVKMFPQMPLNIEIKGSGLAAIPAATELAKELTDLHRLDNAVVTSFDDDVVRYFHGLAPTVAMTPGLNVSAAFILDHQPLPDGMTILQLPPEYSGTKVLTPESIGAAHAAGYVIWVWPNDHVWENPDGYDRLLAMGMDGLNINYPAEGVAAVTRFTTKGAG